MIPAHRARGGGGGGRTDRGGEFVGPGFLDAERERVRQEALEFLGRHRRRFLRGELVALGDAEIEAQARDAIEQLAAFERRRLQPVEEREVRRDEQHRDDREPDAGEHREHADADTSPATNGSENSVRNIAETYVPMPGG